MTQLFHKQVVLKISRGKKSTRDRSGIVVAIRLVHCNQSSVLEEYSEDVF